MKWVNQNKEFPLYRTVKKFAFFPITIGNDTVWFETVYIRQVREVYYPWGNEHILRYEYYYTNEKFITKEEYMKGE